MKLIECLQLAKEENYWILELNDYSQVHAPNFFASFDTVERMIADIPRFREFANLDWHFKSGTIWCEEPPIHFYLWSGYPKSSEQGRLNV